jgi:hypothetical protein
MPKKPPAATKGGKKKDAEEDAVRGRDAKRKERAEWGEKRKKKRSFEWNKDDMAVLAPQLDAVGLAIREIKGDGNCLFRSWSDVLFGNEGRFHELREACCNHLRANADEFSPFLLEEEEFKSFEEYVCAMERDGEWAGNVELAALSAALRANVTIHQAGQRPWMISNDPAGPTAAGLHISYHDGQHYNVVRCSHDMTTKPALALRWKDGSGYEPADGGRKSVADVIHASGGMLVLTAKPKPRAPAPAAAGAGSAAAAPSVSGAGNAAASGAGSERTPPMAGAGAAAPGAASSSAGQPAAAAAAPVEAAKAAATGASKAGAAGGAAAAAPASAAAGPERPRRNGPCPCGSLKAYRKCCMDTDLAAERRLAAIKVSEGKDGAEDDDDRGRRKRGGRGAGEEEEVAEAGRKRAAAARDKDTPVSTAPIFI